MTGIPLKQLNILFSITFFYTEYVNSICSTFVCNPEIVLNISGEALMILKLNSCPKFTTILDKYSFYEHMVESNTPLTGHWMTIRWRLQNTGDVISSSEAAQAVCGHKGKIKAYLCTSTIKGNLVFCSHTVFTVYTSKDKDLRLPITTPRK